MAQLTDTSAKNMNTDGRIGFGQLMAYGSGGIIPIALFNIAGILVGLMGNISLGLSAFWLGVILIIPRLWDAVSDPIVGHISDNIRTPWGRRRPFILVGGILVALCFVMLWWIPKGEMVKAWFPSDAGFQWFQLGYILLSLLLFFTACTIFEIPHGALGMEMTNDPHVRTRLFSAKSFVGNLFAMSTPWLFALANMEIFKGPGGNEADGMRYVSLMVAAILIPLSVLWFFSLREPGFHRVASQKKTPFWHDMKHAIGNRNFIMLTLTIFTLAMGFNFVNLLGSYIPIFYVFGGDKVAGAYLLGINGTVWAVTGVLAVFPLNWISPKLGKRNTLIVAILLMCAAQLSKIVCYNPSYPYLIIIPTVLLSMGMLFFFTLGSSMVGDICDEDDLKTGVRTEGSFYSIFWWFIKMGTALASFVAGALIVFTMFDQTQVTKVDAIQGSIKEIHSTVEVWLDEMANAKDYDVLAGKAQNRAGATIEEMKDYHIYLEKELQRSQKYNNPELQVMRKAELLKAQTITDSTAAILRKIMGYMDSKEGQVNGEAIYSYYEEVNALTLGLKLEKAKTYTQELLLHLDQKNAESNNSQEHFHDILQNTTELFDLLQNVNPKDSLKKIDEQLANIESSIAPLKKQTPYTLLMMRVVEIGLPLLLSIFSIFFILRYSLTEERTNEIKNLLRKRNREIDN
ncbi:MAG: MFS transporter [Tenuifilaceae bacterium]|jgi:GPH family glycoside/pentoside/hexuronide:cation symporter|nr:MFS transporter [Bacteroidales bacterium]MDI9516215.1 MFS transporter [Bacteroidota bacterium]OQC64916.1 MAG: putative symporter YjmB [Bacteroidetes bacterium ADurb.Bin008]HNV80399.1 MFS transporter [Tenuifilaceae bacterium]MZP82548.1 MFS transporter [Bacteroidales bacterium]